MKQYLKLLEDVKQYGTPKGPARENMPGTLSLFGYHFKHDLAEGFPLLTTKKLSFKNIATELCWFLRGDTNIKYLRDRGCNIWNEDAYQYYLRLCKRFEYNPYKLDAFLALVDAGYADLKSLTGSQENILLHNHNYKFGDCGNLYGRQWRNWNGSVDQVKELIKGLEAAPMSRRHLLTAIDPSAATDVALFWCHIIAQFNCREIPYESRRNMTKNYLQLVSLPNCTEPFMENLGIPKYYLDCNVYLRSCDAFLGGPYDLASYALLTHILAKLVNMVPGTIGQSFGDLHIYDNHIDQVNEQLQRKPMPLPKLVIHTDLVGIDAIKPEFFTVTDYQSWAPIKAKLSTGLI